MRLISQEFYRIELDVTLTDLTKMVQDPGESIERYAFIQDFENQVHCIHNSV
jgi:hypothetical protein